jgi:hypothetical protein
MPAPLRGAGGRATATAGETALHAPRRRRGALDVDLRNRYCGVSQAAAGGRLRRPRYARLLRQRRACTQAGEQQRGRARPYGAKRAGARALSIRTSPAIA